MSKKRSSTPKGGVAQPRSVIEYLSPAAIFLAPLNPRAHPPKQIHALAHSIRTHGFNAPILIDKTNHIVAGHGRHAAAILAGLDEVPVIRLAHLTEDQVKAYRLADNKLTDDSSWDDHNLAIVLDELSRLSASFDITAATGFEMPEIDLRIQSLDPAQHSKDADEAFEVQYAPPVSRPGDLWTMGRHRLLCGSALEAPSYGTLLGAERASALFSDPPYNVRILNHASGKGRKKHRDFVMASGDMTEKEFTSFLENSHRLAMSYSIDTAIAFCCMDWRHLGELQTAIRAIDCDLLNLCVWSKTNAGMGALYRSAHELIFVFGRRGERHLNNVQLGKFGRYRTNVWTYPSMASFARSGQVRNLEDHPTVKPIAMVADAILDVTERGSIVLDPFSGSGTTILAAERTGRCGYGIELDPVYVDTTLRRWQKLTGESATHSSGKTFAEMAAERSGSDVEHQ